MTRRLAGGLLVLALLGSAVGQSQPGEVVAEAKISSTVGSFIGPLDDVDAFGRSLVNLGDLTGDGRIELVVGALGDDDGGANRGAVWILSLDPDGSVAAETKISSTAGGFSGSLDSQDWFGFSAAAIGDLDGDGVTDIVVGAPKDDDGGLNSGAVWVLFLDINAAVKSHLKISATSGGFAGPLAVNDQFGTSLAWLGDLDDDGNGELAVGAVMDNDGGISQGAVWILSLASDGSVVSSHKISETQGGFTGVLDTNDQFGIGLGSPGDLNGDGTPDLAVGARADDDGGTDRGAVWILFLATDGSVLSHAKISSTSGGLTGPLLDGDFFGVSITGLGDLDGDGELDIAVGSNLDDDGGGGDRGALYILFLDGAGAVLSETKISADAGGFGGTLDILDDFSIALAPLGDLDGDGVPDLAVSSLWDDDGGADRGAVWVLSLSAAKWIDLGQGLAGTHGAPLLLGNGALVADSEVDLALSNALALAPATLIIGLSNLSAPFKGGVLVPNPLLLIGGLLTDAAGTLELSGTWPSGAPAGFTTYYQHWIIDPIGPVGLAASNGLSGTTPP